MFMIRRHLTKISFILSILLHLFLLLSYTPLSRIHLFSLKAENLIEKNLDNEKRITFELVETPEDARSEIRPEDTHLISNKNSIARDRNRDAKAPSGDPYSEGDLDVKNVIVSQPETPSSPSPSSAQESKNEVSPSQEETQNESSTERFGKSQLSVKEFLARIAPSQHTNHQDKRQDRTLYDNDLSQAEDYGGLTFNTYDWDFAPYLLKMKRKIEKNMYPPPAFTRFGFISGETVIRFRVMPNGEVVDMVVLKHNGHESLRITSEQAILLSSAFNPLPRDFPENYLEVTCSFQYIIRPSHR